MDIKKAIEQIKVACKLGISCGEKIEPKDLLLSVNYILDNISIPIEPPVKPANGGQIHILKTWCEYYKHILDGSKLFEIRKNDRGFKVGDVLVLQEYDKDKKQFTGEMVSKIITYITDYEQKEGYVVMSIATDSRLSV